VLTTDLPTEVVNDAPSNGRDFTQLLQFTPGFAGYSIGGGAGAAQVNGTRSNQVNWQIEGTDNNDLWWNIPAVNQGGVSGIAGIVLPLDAIEQFSFVTSGMPETGRNAGGTVNLSIKSGTNSLHGSAYYYNRNEFFAANSPFNPTAKKTETRDIDYGASVGGPILKDKLFFFASYEHQGFVIGVAQSKTEPSAAYQAEATSVLNFYGVPVNPVSTALLSTLWPQSALTGPATPSNYFNPGTENGHSFNPLVKIDYNINSKNTLSFKGYFGDGNQTAPTSSELSPYFEVAPIHVENYSVIFNHIFSPHLTNQAFFGVSYFDQVFSDAVHNYNPVALGLNTGVTSPGLSGSPKLTIGPSAAGTGLTGGASGFDPLGVTPPEGRQDITGHFDDAVGYTIGKHEFRFGGEFRKAQVYDFYQTNSRGVFTFDGSQGPWNVGGGSAACNALATRNQGVAAPGVTDGNVFFLADFLAGCVSTNNAYIAEGNQTRTVFENTYDLFAQDAWQITPKLNLNYGVRYDYAQSVHDSGKDLTSFNPTIAGGFAIQGSNTDNLYTPFKGSVSPRVGVSYALDDKTTIRAGAGMFFDTVYMLSILNLRGTTDGGALGVGNNLAGALPVVTAQATPTNAAGGAVIKSGVPIFPSLTAAEAGAGITNAYSINPNYRPSYTYSYNLNVERAIGRSMIAQLGYLGTLSRKLTSVLDINPEAVGSNENQATRPYYKQFPNIGNVNQLNSNLNANYNSLQASIRSTGFHGLTSQLSYTWSHALDYETGLIPYLPEDSSKQYLEYGNSDFDTRNTFSAVLNYKVPGFRGPERLTRGWELNSAISLHGGQPFSVIASYDALGNGDNADRAMYNGSNIFAGVNHAIVGGSEAWFNAAAFTDPAPGQYSNQRRNQFFNPGFEDVDFSIVKDTRIAERVSLQLRAETFNIFNRINLAPVGAPQTSSGGNSIGSTIGAFFGAPGIGPGEPFNVQFAGKFIF
ncbi:MAG TPA: TonB-dependent receptor, partial [Acidobacteriaceae bacterium]|nr:TonB-dependent receptor [Acidobacteriaceae bacterium]